MKKRNLGFTLIELMVVMAIIAVLAVLFIGAITVARNAAKETTNRSNARTIQTGLEALFVRNKAYPVCGGVTFLVATTTGGCLFGSATVETGGGSCANGGGLVTSTATGYTITSYQNNCSTTMDTITGP